MDISRLIRVRIIRPCLVGSQMKEPTNSVKRPITRGFVLVGLIEVRTTRKRGIPTRTDTNLRRYVLQRRLVAKSSKYKHSGQSFEKQLDMTLQLAQNLTGTTKAGSDVRRTCRTYW